MLTIVRLFTLLSLACCVTLAPASAQIEAPALDYVAVPDDFSLPPGMSLGSTSGVAINSKGNIFVLARGPNPLMEFDPTGKFIRGFGDGFFDRPHGLRIDAQDNIWTTDVASHVAYKMSPQGRIQLVLGNKGSAGEFHPYGHLRFLNEPNDIAVAPNGEIYIVQGHGRAPPAVLKFDRDGNFIKAWGKKGKGPGEFDIAHSVAIDAKGLVYVADRNNQRIQVFDAEGAFVREWRLPGTPCGLFITPDQTLWLAHGHAGQVLKLDLDGKILGAVGKQGRGVGQFGEAHSIAVSARNEIFVADTLNWRVQKFVKKAP
jgi:DNA-binding beta-propeller fold protein YncE